jgi:hypothetical protein
MEHEGSLHSSQQPATALCLEPDESSPQPQSYFSNIYFILFSHLRLGFYSGPFPSCFPTKPLYVLLSYVLHALPSQPPGILQLQELNPVRPVL